jgi:DNA-binding NarL/FixJ family response regulator
MPGNKAIRSLFTEREAEVIGWLVAGASLQDIATRVGTSEATVRVHLATIRTKTVGWESQAEGAAASPASDRGSTTASPELDPVVQQSLARWLAAAG